MARKVRFLYSFTFLLSTLLTFQISIPTLAQTSGVNPSYGMPSGTISFSDNKYNFYYGSTKLYEYDITKGTFNGIKAYAGVSNSFYPSVGGGLKIKFGSTEYYAFDSNISYSRISNVLQGDSVIVYWKMYKNSFPYDSIKYKYIFKIIGRTLSIRVVVDDIYKNNIISLELDRSEGNSDAYRIEIPYIPLFAVLFCNDVFTSFFSDWELSNASRVDAINMPTTFIYSTRYSQMISYDYKTNGQRNQLNEVLYLTTSSNIEDVFPNIPNPVSAFRDSMANYIVWDYRCGGPSTIVNNLSKMRNKGITNIWLQIHDWQIMGYDNGYPYVLDPTAGVFNDVLKAAIDTARDGYKYGYKVGLHQNYVDYYDNSPGYSVNKVALNFNSQPINAFYNSNNSLQAKLLKPSLADSVANYWSDQIKSHYPKINGSYLDVHSSILPVTHLDFPNRYIYVDYSANGTKGARFTETMNYYRNVIGRLRTNNEGPVQGEGGNQLFYQGYADDIEARLITPTNILGKSIPVFVNFDMLKLRPKAFVHGVGVYPIFYSSSDASYSGLTQDVVLSYIATELAYGHGGYLPSPEVLIANGGAGNYDQFFDFAKLEYNHVFSVQKDYANATPISIQYYDGVSLKTASEYIKAHPENYDNITSNEFMGRVRVEYDNGVIVYVNRHPFSTWAVSVGTAGGWFNYNINGTPVIGTSDTTSFTLPTNNGWVVYDPLKNSATSISISGPSEIIHPIQRTDPNITYTWKAVVTGVTSPVTYTWKQNGTVVGTGPIFTKTLTYIGSYSPYTFQLTLEIQDASVPVKSLTFNKTVTVGLILKENAVENNLPKEFSLQQNYPNPFNPTTEINYSLPKAGKVSLIIYDILGREVTTLVNQIQEPGYYSAAFNGSAFASGVYIARIIVNSSDKETYTKTIKMLMAK